MTVCGRRPDVDRRVAHHEHNKTPFGVVYPLRFLQRVGRSCDPSRFSTDHSNDQIGTIDK